MKKMIEIAFVAAFVAIAGYGVYANQKADVVTDLALADVEAIAACEVSASGSNFEISLYDSCGLIMLI